MVSGHLPPEEKCPSVRVRVWVRVSFRFWGATRQLPPRKIAPRLGLGFGLGLVLGFGVAIFLGGNCPRTHHNLAFMASQ